VRWLLDTNILIAISKCNPALLPRLQNINSADICLSSIVLSEIEYGIAKSARKQTNRQVFEAIVHAFPVHAYDETAAGHYGLLRAELEAQGRLIGPNDMLIAAHALALGCVLVTDNVREFERVGGLRVENWLDG
jgi:tRNA(fMet)-specific endonuclease VapC